MSLSKRTLQNSGWQFSLVSFRTVAQLFVIAILARLLTPEDFGLVAIANIAIGFVAMFTQFGLGQALIQRKNLSTTHIRVGYTAVLLSALILTLGLMLAAPLFGRFFRNDAVTDVLRVLSLSFVLTNIGVVAESLLVRDLAFGRIFRATVVTYTLGYALVGICLAFLGFGVWALVGATLTTDLLKSIFMLHLRPHPKRPLLAKNELRELIHFGGGITLANLANYAGNTGDYFVIGRWLGPASLGIYQQAFNVMLLPAKYLGDALDRVLFASASQVQDKAQSLTRGFRRSVSMTNLVLMPASMVIVVLAPEIILTLFGPQWQAAVVPLQVLSIGISFRTVSRVSDAFVTAKGAVYESAYRKILYALVVIVGSFVGLRWGLNGVAVAVTAAVILYFLLSMQLVLRLTDTSWHDLLRDLTPGLLFGLLALIMTSTTALALRKVVSIAPAVLIGSLLITFVALLGFLWIMPLTLGSFGPWLSQEMRGALPSIGNRLKRYLE